MKQWIQTKKMLLEDNRSIDELEDELKKLGTEYRRTQKKLDDIIHQSIIINSKILLKTQYLKGE